MILRLNNLEVECVIGELPEERTRTQRLRLDIELDIDERASVTDSLDDTLDYAALANRIRATLTAARCRMIERAARLAAETCRSAATPRSPVRFVRVSVTKFGAIPQLGSATAVFTL